MTGGTVAQGLHRRRRVLAGLAAAAIAPRAASAQSDWPSRPLRFVVPFAPGGASDVTARLTGQHLGAAIGRPIVVDNKAGAASTIAATDVARAAPDGYTMLLTPPPFVITQFAMPNLPYDPEQDLRPVVLLMRSPAVLVARKGLAAGGFPEIVAMAKAKPGALTYGSPGVGSLPHVAFELLKLRAGIDVLHVPYRGGGPVAADLAAGRIDLSISSPLDLTGQLQAGSVVLVACAAGRRAAAFPDLPTLTELGVPDQDSTIWAGVTIPARTPDAIVERLNSLFNDVLALAEVRSRLADLGAEPAGGSVADFSAFLTTERTRWREAVTAARITLQ